MLKEIAMRRSVRSYTDVPVEKEKMLFVLAAGNQAPTGRNSQNLLFVGVLDPDIRKKLFDYLGGGQGYYGAPAIVLVFERVKDPLTPLNAGAAMENMLLEATHLGLASCWIHSTVSAFNRPEEKHLLKELLHLPGDYDLVETMALGYGKDIPQEKKRNADNILLR